MTINIAKRIWALYDRKQEDEKFIRYWHHHTTALMKSPVTLEPISKWLEQNCLWVLSEPNVTLTTWSQRQRENLVKRYKAVFGHTNRYYISDRIAAPKSLVGSLVGSETQEPKSLVGSLVGSETQEPKSLVGSLVGSDVGSLVGSDVGSLVGSDVGSLVGSLVGSKCVEPAQLLDHSGAYIYSNCMCNSNRIVADMDVSKNEVESQVEEQVVAHATPDATVVAPSEFNREVEELIGRTSHMSNDISEELIEKYMARYEREEAAIAAKEYQPRLCEAGITKAIHKEPSSVEVSLWVKYEQGKAVVKGEVEFAGEKYRVKLRDPSSIDELLYETRGHEKSVYQGWVNGPLKELRRDYFADMQNFAASHSVSTFHESGDWDYNRKPYANALMFMFYEDITNEPQKAIILINKTNYEVPMSFNNKAKSDNAPQYKGKAGAKK